MWLAVVWAALGCGGRVPDELAASAGRLADCPTSPNCVSSLALDEQHAIAPFELRVAPAQAWASLREVVSESPRVAAILRDSDRYLYAVYASRLMCFRDDVEFLLDAKEERIEVRSAARLGYADWGVNRERVEAIRSSLAARGVIRPGLGD